MLVAFIGFYGLFRNLVKKYMWVLFMCNIFLGLGNGMDLFVIKGGFYSKVIVKGSFEDEVRKWV